MVKADAEMAEMAKRRISSLKRKSRIRKIRSGCLLLPERSKRWLKNIIMEIRSGAAGGMKAALFAGDLFNYVPKKYAEARMACRSVDANVTLVSVVIKSYF